MADVELVIKIPEECYKQIQKNIFSIAYDAIKTKEEKKQVEEKFNVVLAIKNGTPLPKGHGELIDRSKLSICPIDITDLPLDKCLMVYLADDVDNAEVIIEPDKENE